METPKVFIFIFFFLIISSIFITNPATSSSDHNCTSSFCNTRDGPEIMFPFRLLSDSQHEDCGYPGFDLSCNGLGSTVVNMPSSGEFLVRDIDYVNQLIHIYDQNNCIPQRLLKLNLSGSPFSGVYSQSYTFINCSNSPSPPRFYLSSFIPINCLSGTNRTVLATTSIRAATSMTSTFGCELIATVPVPIPWPVYDYGYYFGLDDDLHLTWGLPTCGYCAARGEKCGFTSNSSREIGCLGSSRRGLSRAARYVISIGVGVPALICSIAVALYVCTRVKNYDADATGSGSGAANRRRRDHVNSEFSSAVAPQPVVVMVGLDEPTIESYPKTVLGVSKRLPKPDDNTCSICLSEYKTKEELRTIPDCHHSFHSECIDEWLRINATCPICRNSPTPLPTPRNEP